MLGNGFTRKKVGSLTLGEKLQKIRADYRVDLLDVSRETGVRREYLEYLERGEYAKLPADVYVRGFLRSYARFLGADPKVLVRLYDRERSIAKNLGKEPEKAVPATAKPPKKFSFFVVTPKVMIGGMIAACVLGIALYLYHEYRTFVSEPYLVVSEPANEQTVSSDESIVAGKTDRDAKLFLNDQPIFVDESGGFRERVRLQPGMNTITLKVVNRFGKERVETVSILARYDVPANSSEPSNQDSESQPQASALTLSTNGKKPVSILVRSDGREIYRGDLLSGETKKFDCEKGCLVDSTSGSGTLASWNGGSPEPIDPKNAGSVIGVEFPLAPEKRE